MSRLLWFGVGVVTGIAARDVWYGLGAIGDAVVENEPPIRPAEALRFHRAPVTAARC